MVDLDQRIPHGEFVRRTDVGNEWPLGVLVRHDATDEVFSDFKGWIASKFGIGDGRSLEDIIRQRAEEKSHGWSEESQ